MAIYKTRWFERWARKQWLTTQNLCAAMREMTAGLFDMLSALKRLRFQESLLRFSASLYPQGVLWSYVRSTD